MTEYDPAQDEIIVTETAIRFRRSLANTEIADEEPPEVLLGLAALGSLYWSGKAISYDRVRALADTARTILPEFVEASGGNNDEA